MLTFTPYLSQISSILRMPTLGPNSRNVSVDQSRFHSAFAGSGDCSAPPRVGFSRSHASKAMPTTNATRALPGQAKGSRAMTKFLLGPLTVDQEPTYSVTVPPQQGGGNETQKFHAPRFNFVQRQDSQLRGERLDLRGAGVRRRAHRRDRRVGRNSASRRAGYGAD